MAVEVVGLSKRYSAGKGFQDLIPSRRKRHVDVLRSVNLSVPRGGVFGLLGPNGAGKTTLFKILGTLILPTSGTARVFDTDIVADPAKAKELLTYVISDERSLFWRLTGRENLEYFAALNNIPARESRSKIAALIDLLGLSEAADRRVMFYSSGMRQKLTLGRGLLVNPEVLLLDEPTRSLDPLSARDLWKFIREELIGRQEKTILLATHNLDEARNECGGLAILHRGEVRASGTPESLMALLKGAARYRVELLGPPNGLVKVMSTVPGVHDVRMEGADGATHHVDFAVDSPREQVPGLLSRIVESGGYVISCTPVERSLTDVLAELTAPSQR